MNRSAIISRILGTSRDELLFENEVAAKKFEQKKLSLEQKESVNKQIENSFLEGWSELLTRTFLRANLFNMEAERADIKTSFRTILEKCENDSFGDNFHKKQMSELIMLKVVSENADDFEAFEEIPEEEEWIEDDKFFELEESSFLINNAAGILQESILKLKSEILKEQTILSNLSESKAASFEIRLKSELSATQIMNSLAQFSIKKNTDLIQKAVVESGQDEDIIINAGLKNALFVYSILETANIFGFISGSKLKDVWNELRS